MTQHATIDLCHKTPARQSSRKLLCLLPFAPRLDATHGGGRVTGQMITELTRRHQVALLYLRAPSEPPVDDALQQRCAVVEEVIRPEGAVAVMKHRNKVSSMLRGRPLWAAYTAVPEYESRLKALARSWRPDIVQIEFHVMGQYAFALDCCPAPRVLTDHEPGAKAARDVWQSSQGIARASTYVNWRAWERFERRIIGQVHAVVVFTERDRQALVELGSPTPIVRIPVGTILPEHPLSPDGHKPLSLLFVGNFKHPPNVEAAIRLITSIFPPVRSRFPGLVLYIVGDEPPHELRKLGNKNVIITGRVPDVTHYLNNATVVVAPLRLGGGMRVKILESLAAGKAVIASPLAIEGLDGLGEEQIILATTNEHFSEAVVGLLGDPQRRALLAAGARTWACANLGWDKSVAAYETLYENLLEPTSMARHAQ